MPAHPDTPDPDVAPVDRRRFLRSGLIVGTGIVVASYAPGAIASSAPRSIATGTSYVPSPSFPEGVMSGDPLHDRVVLWTRVLPDLDTDGGVTVRFVLARTPEAAVTGEGSGVVASGTRPTGADRNHTVHFDVDGLAPDTEYWYAFECRGERSPVGRTRTTPAPGAPVASCNAAFFSCQRYTHGFYPVHRDIAEGAFDVVVSLGDYVYDTGFADNVFVPGREDPIGTAVDLAGFRRKYALYRSDVQLQAMQASAPLVAIFDNHDGCTDPWDPQRAGAVGAFFEHMPIRPPGGAADPWRQYRRFAWGDLAEFFMLDERQYRDVKVRDGWSFGNPAMFDPARTMLGAEQRAWLLDGLAASGARWKVLGNQLMLTPWRLLDLDEPWLRSLVPGWQHNAGYYLNMIQWDGYQADRRALARHIAASGIENVIAMTGDAHIHWAAELPVDFDDPASPNVLTEFLPSSVTSANGNEYLNDVIPTKDLAQLFKIPNAQLRFVDTDAHGYAAVRFTPNAAEVTFRAPDSVRRPDSAVRDLARFRVPTGSQRIDVLT
jgi:alkaline phosphatase D